MKDKFPDIFKTRVDKLKTKVQKEFYYHNDLPEEKTDHNEDEIDKTTLLKKINNIFTKDDYVYKADITILFKNGENINKNVIGFKDGYLLCIDGEKILLDDIYDIK